MKKNLIIWGLLTLILLLSFIIRVVPKLEEVFQPSMVMFTEVDPWYHMRLADYMETNFPKPLIWDQYATLGGSQVGYYPVMAWLIVGTSLVTKVDYNIIGAYLPPVAACLCLILIFLIGSTLFKSKRVGLGAALIASILPTQFLARSMLGNTDHHILEDLFLFLSALFIIKFLENYKIRYSILGGLSLSLYFMNWWGSFMILVPLVVTILITSITLKLKEVGPHLKFHIGTLILSILTFLPLLLIKDSLTDPTLYLYSAIGLIGLSIYLTIISFLNKRVYIAALTLLLISGLGIAYSMGLIEKVVTLTGFAFGSIITTIQEALPMDIPTYFYIYNVGAIVVLPGIYLFCKNKYSLFFMVLTLFFFTISIFQIRWSYYLILSVAVLCSYFIYWLSENVAKNFKAPIYTVALLMLLIPSIKENIQMINQPLLLTPSWEEALIWLNINTPKPFNDQRAYLDPNPGEPKYTVLSWWDYGHWIIRIGQRVPLTSPTIQQFKESLDSQVLTAQTPEESLKLLKGLKVRYIIIDNAMVTGKFYALVIRQQGLTIKDVSKFAPNALVLRLYREKVPGFTLRYNNGDIKIIEVDNYEKVSSGL